MPSPGILPSLIQAAGIAAPVVAQQINQHRDERQHARDARNAANASASEHAIEAPARTGWPLWAKVALGLGATVTVGALSIAAYRALEQAFGRGGKGRRKNPRRGRRRRERDDEEE